MNAKTRPRVRVTWVKLMKAMIKTGNALFHNWKYNAEIGGNENGVQRKAIKRMKVTIERD